MRLRIVEKKIKLTEADDSSELEVSMSPLSYIKLTTEYADFNAIYSFVSSGKHEKAKDIPSLKARKSFIEKELGSSKTPLSIQLLLGAINFLKPAEDATSWGSYNPEKGGTASLAVEVSGDVGKVKNHEGRNRSLFLFMSGEAKINVSIYFTNANIKTVSQIPSTFVSQFDDKSKVFKNDISNALEKDKNKFKTIEGFINSLGPFPKQAIIDDLKQKTIKVAGEEVALMKAVMVDKKPDGSYTTSIFKTGLYDIDVLSIPKSNDINYWVEVSKHKLPPESGPVTIS